MNKYFYIFSGLSVVNIIFGFWLGANPFSSGIGWSCAILYCYAYEKNKEMKK